MAMRDIGSISANGAFKAWKENTGISSGAIGSSWAFYFKADRVVPVGDRNRPVNIGLFATIQYQ